MISFIVLFGCEEKKFGPIVTDSVPPGQISDPEVNNIAGGATIKYLIPSDVDFAYVKAVFERNGVQSDARASVYSNTLTIEGLSNTDVVEVNLYSVDKSGNMSSPVSVVISPLTPPYLDVFSTITIEPDFGGAIYNWKNMTGMPVQVEIFAADSTGTLRSRAIVPSNIEEGTASLRGYDTIPRVFGALVFDKWGNYTPDTLKETITPWYEEEFNKDEWLIVDLPNDEDWSAWAGQDYNMFDNDISNFCHTWGGGLWPPAFTIDLGGVKKLSRMKLWMRSTAQQFFYYSHGNPKSWKIFGRADAPDPSTDVAYVDDETWEDLGWTLMKNDTPGNLDPAYFVMVKPSELGGSADEDLIAAKAGHDFVFGGMNPKVRYLRVIITETWDGANYVTFSELSFFGSSK
jgi:hypothetical protein